MDYACFECGKRKAQGGSAFCADCQPPPEKRPKNSIRCRGCGRDFGGMTAFSRHRFAFNCLPPPYKRLEQDAEGVYRQANDGFSNAPTGDSVS